VPQTVLQTRITLRDFVHILMSALIAVQMAVGCCARYACCCEGLHGSGLPDKVADGSSETDKEDCTHCRCARDASVFLASRNQERSSRTLKPCQPVASVMAANVPLGVRSTAEQVPSRNGRPLWHVRFHLVNQVLLI
jgi:hypothetical protein